MLAFKYTKNVLRKLLDIHARYTLDCELFSSFFLKKNILLILIQSQQANHLYVYFTLFCSLN